MLTEHYRKLAEIGMLPKYDGALEPKTLVVDFVPEDKEDLDLLNAKIFEALEEQEKDQKIVSAARVYREYELMACCCSRVKHPEGRFLDPKDL